MFKHLSIAALVALANLPVSAQAVPASSSWIVGAWVDRGSDCAGDTGIVFNRDGTYSMYSESGRWSLAGDVLTFTALETFSMGDPGSERRVRHPRPVASRVLSHQGNAMVMRDSRGRVWPMTRCR